MTAKELKTIIRRCLAIARGNSPMDADRRARDFVAAFSGCLALSDKALGNEVFALLQEDDATPPGAIPPAEAFDAGRLSPAHAQPASAFVV